MRSAFTARISVSNSHITVNLDLGLFGYGSRILWILYTSNFEFNSNSGRVMSVINLCSRTRVTQVSVLLSSLDYDLSKVYLG